MQAISSWLLENGVHQLVEWIVGAIIGVATALLTTALVQRGEVIVGRVRGSTRQSPQIFVVGALCAALAIAALIWGVLDPTTVHEPTDATAWACLVGAFALGFIVMSAYARHRWDWDEKGLYWRGAFRRTSILWADLTCVGRSWDGQFVARDRRGRAIRWTTFALEHAAIADAAATALRAQGA
jgi:hypothetical protein